jgi:hypothetical protein
VRGVCGVIEREWYVLSVRPNGVFIYRRVVLPCYLDAVTFLVYRLGRHA